MMAGQDTALLLLMDDRRGPCFDFSLSLVACAQVLCMYVPSGLSFYMCVARSENAGMKNRFCAKRLVSCRMERFCWSMREKTRKWEEKISSLLETSLHMAPQGK